VGGDEDSPHTLLGDTGVTRSSSSVLWMVATFASAATMLRCGFILDRLGPMKALSGTAVLLGLSLGALSFSSSTWSLFLGLYCLRLFGQGCMMLIPPYTVAMWWVERRGFAYAITLSIGSLGINYAYPMLAKSVMDMPGYSWRDVLRINGLICFCGTLPLGLLFYRGRPELYGLLPDARRGRSRRAGYGQLGAGGGQSAGSLRAKQAAKAAAADARAWVARDALRTASLWATCSGVCLIAAISMGVWFHLVGLVADATPGHVMPGSELSTVFAVQTVGQMVAKFVSSQQRSVTTCRLTRQLLSTVLQLAAGPALGADGAALRHRGAAAGDRHLQRRAAARGAAPRRARRRPPGRRVGRRLLRRRRLLRQVLRARRARVHHRSDEGLLAGGDSGRPDPARSGP